MLSSDGHQTSCTDASVRDLIAIYPDWLQMGGFHPKTLHRSSQLGSSLLEWEQQWVWPRWKLWEGCEFSVG